MELFGPFTVQVPPQFLNVGFMFTTLEFQLCKYSAHWKWGDVRIGCELPLHCTFGSQDSWRFWGRQGGWSGRLEEANL